MAKIFLSYRRDDSADVTGRIRDRLVQQFGATSVFTDVNSIPLGVNFSDYIDDEVRKCDIFLAAIGPDWLTVAAENGQRRLDNSLDFVRKEIEYALKRQIPVIPLLVSGAPMPTKNDLPESLQELAFRNGIPVRADPDFHRDLDQLISSLENHVSGPKPQTLEQVHSVEDSIQADMKEEENNIGSATTFFNAQSKLMLWGVGLVIIASFTAILATSFVSGYFFEESRDIGRPVGNSELLSSPTILNKLSTNIDNPIWLPSNELRGKGVGKQVSHYYAFFAGPGEVKVTVDGRNTSGCGVTNAVGVKLYSLDAKELLKIHMGNTVVDKRKIDRVEVYSRQQLIMRVSLDPCSTEYLVRLEGDIEFVED